MNNLDSILSCMEHEYNEPVKLHSGSLTRIKYEIERLTDKQVI